MQSERAGEWLKCLEDEHDNIRAAIGWLFKDDAEKSARLAAAIRIYLINHSHLIEGREWLKLALESGNRNVSSAVRFNLLNGLGLTARYQGDYVTARKVYEIGLTEGKAINDLQQISLFNKELGSVAYSQNDIPAARKFAAESLAISRKINDDLGSAIALNSLGVYALMDDDKIAAQSLFKESLAIFRQLENKFYITALNINLGVALYNEGQDKTAYSHFVKALTMAQELGNKVCLLLCFNGFAALAFKRGALEYAAQLSGAVAQLSESVGFEIQPSDRRFRDAYLAKLKTKMDEAAFAELYEQGRKLKLEEAVALCELFDKRLENSQLPDAENATTILQATTGDINRKTAETNYGYVRQIELHRPVMFILLIGLIIVSVGIFYVRSNFIEELPMNFQPQKSTRLTAVGKAVNAVISPDGRYVVYVVEDDGQQSLWLRHIASESTVQLLPSGINNIFGLQFSPDSNHVYYNSNRSVYQIPVLGGTPAKVLDDIKGGLTFSPDAKHIAFRRIQGQYFEINSIIIADTDGTNQRQLISREDIFDSPIAWSPDGKIIACIRVNPEKFYTKEILAVQVADGSAASIPSPVLLNIIGQIVWMPDGKSLLIVAAALDGDEAGLSQILQVQYPGGETQSITKDSSDYTNVSLTADGHSLVSVKLEHTAHIWTMPADDINGLKQLTFGSDKNDGGQGISYLSDGRTVYDSTPNRKSEAWTVGADGNDSRQLMTDAGFTTVSPDGRYLVYQNTIKEKVGLWRMDLSNGSKKQLTQKADLLATFSPDGKWIVYQGFTDQTPPASLYKVSIDGGEIIQLTKSIIPFSPTVSPDGKQIAFSFGKREGDKYKQYIALMPFSGGEITKMFDTNLQYMDNYGKQNLQWTPDGKALNYIVLDKNVSNIWQKPIDGSASLRITNFTNDHIFNFAFSPDGSRLALSRGTFSSDVYLIENIK